MVRRGGLARTSLVEVRRSIEALRPGPLRGARLGEAVRQAVTTWREQYGVPAAFTVTGTPQPLHSEVEVTVLRAAQEVLSNVGRHAGARRVDVTLSYMEDVVVLDVRDDGIGFTPGVTGASGSRPCWSGCARWRARSTSSPRRAAARRSASPSR